FLCSSHRRHTRVCRDWSSDVFSSDLQDLVQFRKNGVRLSPDQGRVLQGDVGGQEGFGYAPFFVHRVQAKATAQIAEKVETIAHLPGPQEQTGGKQRFNASHDPFYKTSRMYDGR